MEIPWFGVTKEEKKYAIISINVYDDLDLAKKECRKVNRILEDSQCKTETQESQS